MQKCLVCKEDNGVGRLVHLHLVEKIHLVGYKAKDGGTHCCQVCCATREYAMGTHALHLDGSSWKITKVFLSNSADRTLRALHHCNHGYSYAEIIDI